MLARLNQMALPWAAGIPARGLMLEVSIQAVPIRSRQPQHDVSHRIPVRVFLRALADMETPFRQRNSSTAFFEKPNESRALHPMRRALRLQFRRPLPQSWRQASHPPEVMHLDEMAPRRRESTERMSLEEIRAFRLALAFVCHTVTCGPVLLGQRLSLEVAVLCGKELS